MNSAMFQIPNNPLNSYRKWNVGSVIREILLSDPDLKEEVKEHIYPIIAPEATAGNFIIYKREKYSRDTVHQGIYQDDCQIALTVISDNYDDSVRIAEMIDNTLAGEHLIESNTVRIRITLADSTEGFEDGKYFQILLYSIQ